MEQITRKEFLAQQAYIRNIEKQLIEVKIILADNNIVAKGENLIAINNLINIVSSYFFIETKEVFLKSRQLKYTIPRFFIIYFLKTRYKLTESLITILIMNYTEQLGKVSIFHRSTIYHAIQEVENIISMKKHENYNDYIELYKLIYNKEPII